MWRGEVGMHRAAYMRLGLLMVDHATDVQPACSCVSAPSIMLHMLHASTHLCAFMRGVTMCSGSAYAYPTDARLCLLMHMS